MQGVNNFIEVVYTIGIFVGVYAVLYTILKIIVRLKILNKQMIKCKDIVSPNLRSQMVNVDIINPLTIEKIRNLYEAQDIYNAQISSVNEEIEYLNGDIEKIDTSINSQQTEINIAVSSQPNVDRNIINEIYGNKIESLKRDRLKLQGKILDNENKINQLQKKSNDITEKIDNIALKEYKAQNR